MSPVIGSLKTQRGVSLIELMVALVIGLFLIFGAVTIYQQSRATFRTTEAVARLQEVARLAFDVLEADVRMANYWGLNNRAEFIVNRAGPNQPLPEPFVTLGLGGAIDECGDDESNWVIDLDQYIGGSNNGYDLTCAATGTPSDDSDTLLVRRAAEAAPAALDVKRIYLQTSRVQGTLFVPGCANPKLAACIPSDYLPPASESRALVVNAYYVSTDSTLRADVPALRRMPLGSGPAVGPGEEIVQGVEDIQVQFGVDTNGDTSVDAYVNPGDALLDDNDVISATIWLRIRSEDRDFGHVDGNTYQYADTVVGPLNDNYRRIVVSKTIQLRNTRS